MAEDDFDLDIYGDDTQPANEYSQEGHLQEGQTQGGVPVEDVGDNGIKTHQDEAAQDENAMGDGTENQEASDTMNGYDGTNEQQSSETAQMQDGDVQQEQAQLGVKRKDGPDDRPVDANATTALIISDLQWWETDDNLRGWAHQCDTMDELKEITFSEHKVNGKSKGQVYVEFATPQAATAMKQKIENIKAPAPQTKRPSVVFAPSGTNPYRTLPKDAPARQEGRGSSGPRGGFNSNPSSNSYRGRGGRGGAGGMGGFRGGQATGGYQGAQMNGMGMQNAGNFGTPQMGGFGGAMNMGAFGGGFNNRGGGMNGMMGGGGMRGGAPRGGARGGMNMMGGMPMGNMGAGMANYGMGMGNMGMGMNGMSGFGGNPQGHFNPAFFQGGQQQGGMAGGNDSWNPHGAKRPRPE